MLKISETSVDTDRCVLKSQEKPLSRHSCRKGEALQDRKLIETKFSTQAKYHRKKKNCGNTQQAKAKEGASTS